MKAWCYKYLLVYGLPKSVVQHLVRQLISHSHRLPALLLFRVQHHPSKLQRQVGRDHLTKTAVLEHKVRVRLLQLRGVGGVRAKGR